MGISITQPGNKFHFKKHGTKVAAGVLVLALTAVIYNLKFSPYKVLLNSLSVAEVQYGNFSVDVRGNGVLLPQDINWVSASVDATVETVVYKAGTRVKKVNCWLK